MAAFRIFRRLAELLDIGTFDLPTVNTPLGTALAGKAATSHTHTVSQITDFPTLATVATSGAYADLIGTPTLVVNFGDLGDAGTVELPTVNGPLATALGLKADTASLSTVATTGAYADLTGTPALVVNFADLGDAATVDLPALNAPLQAALDAKTDESDLGSIAGFEGDQNLRTTDDVAFSKVTLADKLVLPENGYIRSSFAEGSSRMGFQASQYDHLFFYGASSSGTAVAKISSTGVLINPNARHDRDFLVRGNADSHLFFVDVDSNSVGIKNSNPSADLDVTGDIAASETIQPGTYTVATLPTGVAGMRATVSDSDKYAQGNFGNTVVAAGAGTPYVVPVFFDGTNWIIA